MTPIDQIMNAVEWTPVEGQIIEDDGSPYATHHGMLRIAGFDLKCYQLNTRQRVIDAEDMERFFGALQV